MDPDAIPEVGRVPHGGASPDDGIDFSANVNPRVPTGVADVVEDVRSDLGHYPDDGYPEFRRAAADYVGCPADLIVPTPGGLAGLRLAIETELHPGDRAIVPAPSFGEYAREVRLQGGDPVFVDPETVLETDPEEADLVVVCNPNNPTGYGYDREAFLAYLADCRAAETTLLVDEAFLGFTDRETLAGEPGAIVARSLTKLFGLPGLRMGFLVATDGHLDRLERARRAWNCGTLATAVGTYCLSRTEFVKATRSRVRFERERVREGLPDRWTAPPSEAPFLLADVSPDGVDAVLDHARDHGIVLRDARTFRGLDSHVRMAIRTPAENDRLLGVLADV